jgi:hypothetical protein
MAHRTTIAGGGGPWLVSRAMWCGCMRWVTPDGITVGELGARTGVRTNLAGMRRWGYVTLDGDVVRPTRAGRRAQSVWAPLTAEIEERWAARTDLPGLRKALAPYVRPGLPDCMPVLGHGLFSTVVARREPHAPRTLPGLLARVLLAVALDHERGTRLSLAVAANALRVLGTDAMPVKDLPARAGVSREAIAMSLGLLERAGLATVHSGRPRIARLTERGVAAQCAHADRRARLDERFSDDLRRRLEAIPFFAGLTPVPGGWRSSAPATLPHFPTVLHRGGFPDGA